MKKQNSLTVSSSAEDNLEITNKEAQKGIAYPEALIAISDSGKGRNLS